MSFKSSLFLALATACAQGSAQEIDTPEPVLSPLLLPEEEGEGVDDTDLLVIDVVAPTPKSEPTPTPKSEPTPAPKPEPESQAAKKTTLAPTAVVEQRQIIQQDLQQVQAIEDDLMSLYVDILVGKCVEDGGDLTECQMGATKEADAKHAEVTEAAEKKAEANR